jgi:ubiquinone biosynthesis monooxygenase Coq7
MALSLDTLISGFDRALRAVASVTSAAPASPGATIPDAPLEAPERKHAAALMRVNHVGEICAQALYHGQAVVTGDAQLREHLERAGAEEGAHLAWTAERLRELGGRPSLLNPVWYAGSFALGALAARLGDPVSLGFVSETELQVERHLEEHIGKLPAADARSRAVLDVMREDEIRHGREARAAGGVDLPLPARVAMRVMGKVMTTTAYYV